MAERVMCEAPHRVLGLCIMSRIRTALQGQHRQGQEDPVSRNQAAALISP